MSTPETTSRISAFLDWAENNDRGTLADLRHGFSPATEYRAWPHLARWCDLADDRQRRIWTTVGAGYATLEKTASVGNFGVTLRKLALHGASGTPDDALTSFDARFRRLLTCTSAEEVCEHLPGIIRAAKSKDVPIDFEQLFWDLVRWGPEIKVRWAACYWEAPETASHEGENAG